MIENAEPQRSLVGARLAHFTVLSELGRGGMGVVYLAEDDALGRTVALKVLRDDVANDAGRRARFLREARAAAAVTHPNLAVIYEVGEHDGLVFLAMERVVGRSLRAELTGEPLAMDRWLVLARGVIAAIAKAHDKGIIHRDLKPENILVAEDGQPKVVDFGLAKVVDEASGVSGDAATEMQLSKEGARIGTPAYMSPEQARGLEVDHRSDIFSLGAVLYEMATGERPFAGRTEMDVLMAIARDAPRPALGRNPELGDALAGVIDRCLAKEASARFASAHEVLRAIDAATGGGAEATPARPRGETKTAAADRKSELILLERVKEFWIDGVLRESTRGEGLIGLTKDERLAAVDRGFELAAPRLDEDEEPIDPRVGIADYFDRRGGALLILGEPGAGKTVTLLELASALVARALDDPTAPLAVVLSLATWRDAKQPLTAWIVEQLRDAYRVPERVGRAWVDGDRLALLLDGLDEVATGKTADCVRAINAFRAERGFVPMAVACRRTDYFALPERIKLDAAIELRALTEEQIAGHLARGGERLAPLARALAEDKELAELARSPLMLQVMSLSYGDDGGSSDDGRAPASASQDDAGGARRKALFDRYVARMLKRRAGRTPFSPERTVSTLGWLARDLAKKNENVFWVEHLQPTSLPPGRWRVAYFFITRFVMVAAILLAMSFNGAPLWVRAVMAAFVAVPLVALDHRASKRPPVTGRSRLAKIGSFFLVLTMTMPASFCAIALSLMAESGASLDRTGVTMSLGSAVLLGTPIAILLAWRRERLLAGSDIRTVESLRLKPRRLAFWTLLLAVVPGVAVWIPLRDRQPGSFRVFSIASEPSASPVVQRFDMPARASRAVLAPGGQRAALFFSMSPMTLVDLTSGEARATDVAEERIAWDPTGRFAASFNASAAPLVMIRDGQTLARRFSVEPSSGANPYSTAVSVDLSREGRLLVATGRAATLYDVGGAAPRLVATFPGFAVMSKDGERVLVRGERGLAVHQASGALVATIDFEPRALAEELENVAIAPSGKWMAVSRGDCIERVELAPPNARRPMPAPGCADGTPHPLASASMRTTVGARSVSFSAVEQRARLVFARSSDRLAAALSDRLLLFDASGVFKAEMPGAARDLDLDDAKLVALVGDDLVVFRAEDGAPIGKANVGRGAATAELAEGGGAVAVLTTSIPGALLGAAFGALGLFFAIGISLETGVARMKTAVNEGMARTSRRALVVGVSIFLLAAFVDYTVDRLSGGGDASLSRSLRGALVFGISFSLGFGGLDLVSHRVLRGLIALRGDLPLRVAPLLESGVQLIFLRRVGGGFIFIHRLVLEHFASAAAVGAAQRRRNG